MKKTFLNKVIKYSTMAIVLSLIINGFLFIGAQNVKTAQIQSDNKNNATDLLNPAPESDADSHAEKKEAFTFEGLFDSSILYRDNGSSPYFLALSPNNSPKYTINKQYIKKFHIDTVLVDHCVINTQKGDIVKLGDVYFTTYCEDYKITENNESIILDSRYETPINSAKISVMSGDESRSILVHNTMQYDKDHPLAPGLWEIDRKYNKIEKGRIVFYKREKKQFNFLSFRKNISENFTVHFSVEPRRESLYAMPFVMLNGEISIDFGYKNGNALSIGGVKKAGGNAVDDPITVPINKEILSDCYRVTISKFNNALKISIQSSKYTQGKPEIIFERADIFPQKRWSTFEIGNLKGGSVYALESIMIVGREDV